ncbi:alpha/beta hydrolase fold-domain-containing protein [Zychaea mexicana]|uniref:alpha/beta hydrolase fold-domain-containing protein n=1 Tax=Zychaea mexicana TaxID=64656 RepID=UPI0022FF2753|nr:alpha/beta hydrolase fold-domain-containing protein [Zychaea mexicana]KAI9489083.1 alpha/beta hydrolase fold-domain-containing protein [Zychaea mexicana]
MRVAANERSKSSINSLSLPKVIEEDKTVIHNGIEVRLTLFRPPRTEKDILPVVIYYHGGGFVFGSKFTHAKPVRDICVGNHVVVVFVDYSLAPEVKCPVIHEECFAALSWVVENGDSIKADTSRLAICGDSAGGNVSACIPLMAKERGLSDAIKTQILIYPRTAASRDHYESFQTFGNGDYSYSAQDNRFFDQAYTNGREKTKIGYPLLATQEEMKGLPPALAFIAEADILRDEGEEYIRNLTAAGVPTLAIRILGASMFISRVKIFGLTLLYTVAAIIGGAQLFISIILRMPTIQSMGI